MLAAQWTEPKSMKVLVCPLNWGLGHATRCIPLLKGLLKAGHEVVIAADGHPLTLLQKEFPEQRFIHSTSYNIKYNKGKSQLTAMLRSLPIIFAAILREKIWLEKLLNEEQFDRVISDNRFGLWSSKTNSIYISHQLMIKMPKGLKWAEPIVWLGHRFFINRFDECWIPDHAGNDNLSGDLSHKYPLPKRSRFIGPLSRFSQISPENSESTIPIVALISGPEPQRSIFEQEVFQWLKNQDQKALLIRGLPANHESHSDVDLITFRNHLPSDELLTVLLQSKIIICRSGYSTLMDLEALGILNKAYICPTPGQTEQEYLTHYLIKKTAGLFPAV